MLMQMLNNRVLESVSMDLGTEVRNRLQGELNPSANGIVMPNGLSHMRQYSRF